MTNINPITPPLELVQQWWHNAPANESYARAIATQAARWGYEQASIQCNKAVIVDSAPKSPTDDELGELFTEIDQSGEPESWRVYARAVLARWGNHPGSPDSPVQPQ